MTESRNIRIAISGGGIAGATVLHALLAHPHLDVHIFEAAPKFKEAGVSIGISRNALAALELIGPSAVQCLERADVFEVEGFIMKLAVGDDQGHAVGEVGKGSLKSVSRAGFLGELLRGVSAERMHTSKKLDRVERRPDGELELRFADGSTHDCDILIGADGVHSTVRKLVLKETDPASRPQNSGWWAIWSLKPFIEAQTHLGISDTYQHGWIGDGTFLMYSTIKPNELIGFIICAHDNDAGDRHSRTVSAEEIRELCQSWPPQLVNAIEAMICNQPEQSAFYIWEHAVPASTYASGPICIIGDAAHATTPWQASGGGMSIEDALILSTLLGRTKTSKDATIALKVYDETRRPRTQRVVESSRGSGTIMTGQDKEIGLDSQLLEDNLSSRWEFIHNFDVKKHRDGALEKLALELGDENGIIS